MHMTHAGLQAMGIDPRKSHDWRQIPARPVDRYYIGWDIGQSNRSQRRRGSPPRRHAIGRMGAER